LELEDDRYQEGKAELNVTGTRDGHCLMDGEEMRAPMGEDPH
jgi:hypothetical protein